MEIHMHATYIATLCLLFLEISSADLNAQRHRTDEAVSRKRRQDTIEVDVKETLQQLNYTMEAIKQDCMRLESSLINQRNSLEQLEDKVIEMKMAVIKQDNNTREVVEKTASALDFRKEFETVIAGIRSELADVKHELVEYRNVLDQRFVTPMEILNQTVQHLTNDAYEDLSRQITELKAEQQRQASAAFESFEHTQNMKEALQQILQLRENYFSKDDQRDKRAISNKCSLNIRHKPEGGRVDVLMVMDPPSIEPAACN